MVNRGSDIARLFAWSCGLSPARLRTVLETAGAYNDWHERAADAARRLHSGVPIGEIVSEIEFLGRTFRWDQRACLIRPYVARFVEQIVSDTRCRKVSVLELGCGAGHIITTLALELEGRFVGADISQDAIALARENVARHGAAVELVVSDMFEQLKHVHFDVVVVTLPHECRSDAMAPEELAWEPAVGMFDPGRERLSLVLRCLRQVALYLKPHGRVYLDLPVDIATDPELPGRVIRLKDSECVGCVLRADEIDHAIDWLVAHRLRRADHPH